MRRTLSGSWQRVRELAVARRARYSDYGYYLGIKEKLSRFQMGRNGFVDEGGVWLGMRHAALPTAANFRDALNAVSRGGSSASRRSAVLSDAGRMGLRMW